MRGTAAAVQSGGGGSTGPSARDASAGRPPPPLTLHTVGLDVGGALLAVGAGPQHCRQGRKGRVGARKGPHGRQSHSAKQSTNQQFTDTQPTSARPSPPVAASPCSISSHHPSQLQPLLASFNEQLKRRLRVGTDLGPPLPPPRRPPAPAACAGPCAACGGNADARGLRGQAAGQQTPVIKPKLQAQRTSCVCLEWRPKWGQQCSTTRPGLPHPRALLLQLERRAELLILRHLSLHVLQLNRIGLGLAVRVRVRRRLVRPSGA